MTKEVAEKSNNLYRKGMNRPHYQGDLPEETMV
jgi:hypothetical protein